MAYGLLIDIGMKPTTQLSSVFALLVVAICTGCATQYSEMVRFSPAEPHDPRTEEQLYRDFNAIMPFQVEPGDFVMSPRLEGPSIWVCFGDAQKTKVLRKVLASNPDWVYCSTGQVNNNSRKLFGLASEPGQYLAGIASSRSGTSAFARN
ncbi:MAG: hypothetical protein O3A51_09420 [Verrucomicrobia bacterium]|nr:hypothetical protein [Verrucomicrobiota bacterium]